MNRCDCENSKCLHGEEVCNKFTNNPEFVVVGTGWSGHLCSRCKNVYESLNYTVEVKA